MKNQSLDGQSFSQDLKPVLPKYKSDSDFIPKSNLDKTLNSVALVRERTIATERPPPVGEVSANFCG